MCLSDFINVVLLSSLVELDRESKFFYWDLVFRLQVFIFKIFKDVSYDLRCLFLKF